VAVRDQSSVAFLAVGIGSSVNLTKGCKHAVHDWTDARRWDGGEKKPCFIVDHPGRIDTPYNEHASYMPKQPSPSGMIYPQRRWLRAILYAAEHRAGYVHSASRAKILAILGAVSPRLTDKLMEVWAFPPSSRSPFSRSGGQCTLSGWLWDARARRTRDGFALVVWHVKPRSIQFLQPSL